MASPIFDVRFRIEPFEYVEAQLTGPSGDYICRCHDRLDGLGDLVRNLASMLKFSEAQTVTKWEMIGQTWWAIDSKGDAVDVNILELEETQKMIPGEHYITVYEYKRCAFSASTSFEHFVSEIVNGLDKLDGYGAGDYEDNWPYGLPSKDLKLLRSYLKARR